MSSTFDYLRSDFQYEPLKESEIRLIKLKSLEPGARKISCEIAHYDLKDCPAYFALSYVWQYTAQPGLLFFDMERTNTKYPFYVDGQYFRITKNLFEALEYISEDMTTLKTLEMLFTQKQEDYILMWVDAVCLDQNNLDEMSTQILRMMTIYSSALTTVVWFGKHTPIPEDIARIGNMILANAMWAEMQVKMSNLFSSASGQAPIQRDKNLLRNALGSGLHDFLIRYMSVLANEWFNRVWVVQEYIVSRQAFCAPGWYTMEGLLAITDAIHETEPDPNGSEPWLLGMAKASPLGGFAGLYIKGKLADGRFARMTLAERLLNLLSSVSGKKCTNPHDAIYGVLSLACMDGTDLPVDLQPDYGKPLIDVYKTYARYIIQNTGKLEIMASHGPRLRGQPSWVPRPESACLSRLPWLTEKSASSKVRFSDDGELMTVQGVEIGRVTAFHGHMDDSTEILTLHEEIFEAAAKIREVTVHQVFVEWFRSFREYHDFPMDGLEHINSSVMLALALTRQRGIGFTGRLLDTDLAQLMHGALEGIAFMLLDNGHIFHSPYDDLKKGDAVWALKGMQHYSVLRYDGNDTVSASYVTHSEPYTPKRNYYLAEEFFLQKAVRDITLI
jgi:hypothetical protein